MTIADCVSDGQNDDGGGHTFMGVLTFGRTGGMGGKAI